MRMRICARGEGEGEGRDARCEMRDARCKGRGFRRLWKIEDGSLKLEATGSWKQAESPSQSAYSPGVVAYCLPLPLIRALVRLLFHELLGLQLRRLLRWSSIGGRGRRFFAF